MPDVTELPDKGFAWQEQWAVNLKCVYGTDAGTEVMFKPTTVGGKPGHRGLIEAVRDRLNGGQHDGKVVADRACSKSTHYPHRQYGKTWIPLLTIVDWMPLNGPAPAPAPASPSPTIGRRATASPARRA